MISLSQRCLYYVIASNGTRTQLKPRNSERTLRPLQNAPHPKAPLPSLLGLDGRASSPGGSALLPLTDGGGHCAHWDLQSSRDFPTPFLRFVPPDNPVHVWFGL